MTISVIVPACNEERVIGRCLKALLTGAAPGELEIVVACNGCTDGTADAARAFGEPVRVIETVERGKTVALNLGEEHAAGFPRFYVDADVEVDVESLRRMAAALDEGPALAAGPEMRMSFGDATWAVRAYYAIWQHLPYTREGMIGVGCYALHEEGRTRFERFPDVISDDGYVRALFTSSERTTVPGAASVVTAPSTLAGLLKIKTRSRLGGYELNARFPELMRRERREKEYGDAFRAVAMRPWLWPHAVVYLGVNLVSRARARRQFPTVASYEWERDDSSR